MSISTEIVVSLEQEPTFLQDPSTIEEPETDKKGWFPRLFGLIDGFEERNPYYFGIGFAIGSAVSNFVSSIFVQKGREDNVSIASVMALRGFLVIFLQIILLRPLGSSMSLLSFCKSWFHFLLVLVGMLNSLMYFLVLYFLPLTDALILILSSPLFSIFWNIIFYCSLPSKWEILTIFVALSGMFLTVQPEFIFERDSYHPFSLMGSLFGLLYAFSASMTGYVVKKIGESSSAYEKVYLIGLGITLCGVIWSAFDYKTFINDISLPQTYTPVIGISISSGFVYQYCYCKAPMLISIQKLMMLQYLTVIFGICHDCILGRFDYDWLKITGIVIVVGSCLFIIKLRSK